MSSQKKWPPAGQMNYSSILGIEDLDLFLNERMLSWYGHVEYSGSAIKLVWDIQVTGSHETGKPKMTWKQVIEREWRDRKLSNTDPQVKNTRRSWVRYVMRAASQLPGRGSADVRVALYQNYDNDDGFYFSMDSQHLKGLWAF